MTQHRTTKLTRRRRRLRLERCESRCVLSAATVAVTDTVGDDDLVIAPPAFSGWLTWGNDSGIVSLDEVVSTADASASTTIAQKFSFPGVGDFASFDTLSPGLTVVVEGDLDISTGLTESLEVAAASSTWDLSGGRQQGAERAPLRSALGASMTYFDGMDQVLGTPVVEGAITVKDDLGAELNTAIDRWYSQGQVAVTNTPHNNGWIPDDVGAGSNDGLTTNGSDGALWPGADPSSDAQTPPLIDNTVGRGKEIAQGGDDALDADQRGGNDETRGALSWRGLSSTDRASDEAVPKLRPRIGSAGLRRVVETPAPPAGEETPGAGMIDLAALLLPASDLDTAPTAALAAADQPGVAETSVSARDEALAVESWVRTLPVPTEPADAVGSVAPPVESPAIGVRPDVPVKDDSPLPEAPRDRVSAAGAFTPVLAPNAAVTPAEGSESLAQRIDEQQAPGRFGYVTAWLTAFLGGAVVWAGRRGDRNLEADCIELPRRESARTV